LTYKRFKQYVSVIEKETEQYFDKYWGNEGEAELMQSFNEVTVLTSTSCLQGKEIRDMSSEFAQLYWDLDKSLSAIGFFFPNIPLPSMIGRDRARKKMGDMFMNIIKRRRENPGGEHEDIIQTLMECQYKDGTPVPDDQIVGMMIALLLAGQHTSNVTGAWTGVHLLQNPDVL
jgi:sterol 14-demethylase